MPSTAGKGRGRFLTEDRTSHHHPEVLWTHSSQSVPLEPVRFSKPITTSNQAIKQRTKGPVKQAVNQAINRRRTLPNLSRRLLISIWTRTLLPTVPAKRDYFEIENSDTRSRPVICLPCLVNVEKRHSNRRRCRLRDHVLTVRRPPIIHQRKIRVRRERRPVQSIWMRRWPQNRVHWWMERTRLTSWAVRISSVGHPLEILHRKCESFRPLLLCRAWFRRERIARWMDKWGKMANQKVI